MIRLSVVLISLLVATQSLSAQSWPSFQNGGKVHNANWKIPTSWSPDSNILWQTSLVGYGQSTPIVHFDRVYVTSVAGQNKETVNVEAFKIEDGKRIWHYERGNSTQEKNTVMVSRSAATPVVDEKGVIAFYEGGNLVALDHDGKLRWESDIAAEYGPLKARHGLASSLEQDDKYVFVWAQRIESPFIMAIDKFTGKTVWKKETLEGTSWGSPRLIHVENEKHLVLSASGSVIGINPNNGERLWTFEDISGNSSSTPMPLKSGEFLIGSMGSRSATDKIASSGVVQVRKSGDKYQASWKWKSQDAKCSFGSPIACNDRAYFVNRSGVLNCLNLATGESLFKGRLPSGSIWATPLATKDCVYFFGKDGDTTIVKAADSLQVVEKNSLWKQQPKNESSEENAVSRFGGSVLYAAAIAGEKLIMRKGDRLYAVSDGSK